MGLPGYWVVLFTRAVATHSAGYIAASLIIGDDVAAFRQRHALDTRDDRFTEPYFPRPACSSAYASTIPSRASLQG